MSSSLPPLSQTFSKLLISTPFLLLLAHMTELELVEDAIKITDANLDCADISSAGRGGVSSVNAAESAEPASSLELRSSALCRGEVCLWRHGNYTLAGDPCDPGLGRFCLEASISFNSEGDN